ncbi:MAG TPA: DivIVA domain-containing protein [Chthonomonadales bacterium]|nr:DivIVA domain-containing protein [Chthonomonadales bacterium]
MRRTRTDLLNPQFRRVWRGYDPGEVHAALRELLNEIDALHVTLEAQKRAHDAVEARLSDQRDCENAINQALIAAHKVAKETRHAAQEDAVRIVRDARSQAESIERQSAERIQQLQEQRRRAVRELRALLRSHLERLTEEAIDVAGPGAAAGAPTIVSVPALPVTPEPPSTNGA